MDYMYSPCYLTLALSPGNNACRNWVVRQTKAIITVDLMVRENDSNIRFLMPHYLHK